MEEISGEIGFPRQLAKRPYYDIIMHHDTYFIDGSFTPDGCGPQFEKNTEMRVD